jgi:predicted O-methyltransferase YrrM
VSLAGQFLARAGGSWTDIRDHLPFIHEQALGRGVMAELGVRAGNSACALLAAIEVAGGGDLYSVDIADAQVPAAWHRLVAWHFLKADDMSERARAFVPARLDLLFIDTSHAFGHTLDELGAYGSRVRPGGIILCHDTHWDEGDIELPGPDGPVARALTEWCARENLQWEDRPGSYGLGIVRIPS